MGLGLYVYYIADSKMRLAIVPVNISKYYGSIINNLFSCSGNREG